MLEADLLVDGCLVIEVMGSYFHTKKRRVAKDIAKRNVFEHMGYGVLWVWDDELRYASQVRKGKQWTTYIKDMVKAKLKFARRNRKAYSVFQKTLVNDHNGAKVLHPEFEEVLIRRRRE
jgi:hypothetical protein